MLEIAELVQSITNKINEFIPAAADKITKPVFTDIFRPVNFAGQTFRSEAFHSQGRFKQFANGMGVPEEQAFEGGLVQITPVPLGSGRSWTRSIADKMVAEGAGDLEGLVDRWFQAYWASMDIQAAAIINGTATGYDGQALFSTAHPLKSKTQTGSSLVNTDATAAVLDADFLQTLLQMHEDDLAYDEAGEPTDNFATHLLADSRKQYQQLKALIKSDKKPGTNNNDINVERDNYIPVLWRRLAAGQTNHYIQAVSANQGLVFVSRTGLMQNVWFENKTYTVNATAMYEAAGGWSNFRSISRKLLS